MSDAGVDAYVPGAPDATTPLSPEERFLRDYQRARCERAVRCAHPGWHPEWPWGPPAQVCHPALDDWVNRARRLLAAGQLTFDPEAAAECLDHLAARRGCGFELFPSDRRVTRPCDHVLLGTGGEGEPCEYAFPAECAPGLRCDAPMFGERGTCVPLIARGEACERFIGCEGWPEDGGCLDGVCRGDAALGEGCSAHQDCSVWLFCVDGACSDPYVGMACDGVVCGTRLWCDDGTCVEGAAEGEPCGFGCADGLACSGDPAVCTSADGRDAGDYCVAFDFAVGDDSCLGDLVCRLESDFTTFSVGRCVVGQPEDAPCDETTLCTKGSRCVDGACVGMVLPGEACGADAVCPLTHACVGDVCEPLPAPGEACVADVGCLQGRCVEGVCCLAAEWTVCDPSASEPVLGICASDCLSDEMCGRPLECGPACDGHTCWRSSDRCAPACPAP